MRHHHLSDHDLVLALGGELPVRRQAAVDAHLTECTSCRTRRSELDEGSELAMATYRSTLLDAEGIAASREALRAKLVVIARQQDTLIGRFVPSFAGVSQWAVGVAAVVVAVLLVRILQPAPVASVENGALPVASLTPGATWNVTVAEVCAPGLHEQRPVSDTIRMEVLRRYRMERVSADQYELDYLITPELGGAPDTQNLWPQRYASRVWNAHVKDQLEHLLPRLVCDGAITLETAQRDIAVDWIAAYKKYFHTDVPVTTHASSGADSVPDLREDVITYPIWRRVDTASLKLISFTVSR